jgi:uncharacterized membrane protein YhaH (DUF805 family)
MTFGSSVSTCFSKYANFDDRAPRSEYWWFYLFGVLLQWISSFIAFGGFGLSDVLSGVAFLAIAFPTMAVGARRLHDIDKSGWNQLWAFTIIGMIPLIIWFCTEGTKEANKFGDPIDLSS